MKIRSITYFFNPGWPLDEKKCRAAGFFLSEARSAFENSGYEVQTVRLATNPFPQMLGAENIKDAPHLAVEFSAAMRQAGVAYGSLGPALPAMPKSYAVIPEAVAASQDVFFGGVMAEPRGGISLSAVQACAQVINDLSTLEENGFANLRFAALANVPAGAPFFPAAYHGDEEPAFAIATEAADLAVSAFKGTRSVEEGRKQLVSEIERLAGGLATVANLLKFRFSTRFLGIDFSLAPFPVDDVSLGGAVEHMGVPAIGLHGSLAAAAILTEAVERANFPHVGFSGFMQPVLEDSVLARRTAEGTLTIKDLLLYSAVCGTGLDTVPLAGDTRPEQISALLLDICALALRLNKPLTARLMPIPGKKAGEETSFEFGFFANSRVMALEAQPLQAALGGNGSIELNKRRAD